MLEVKTIIIKLKSSQKRFKRLKQAGKKLENLKKFEIIKSKKQKGKRIKNSEENQGTYGIP